MSWINLLSETYDNLSKADNEETRGLLPIGHSTQKAHIEVTIDENGEFVRADFVVDVTKEKKNLSETIIPVTESSGSRSNGSTPHPLCDKLKYLAGDYKKYCGEDNQEDFQNYMNQLEDWVSSEFTNEKIQAIYKYLEKQTLIKDLIKDIFSLNDKKQLTEKWDKSSEILTVGNQREAFIRFRVLSETNNVAEVWQDKKVQKDYINYYLSKQKKKDFCYVTGNIAAISINHPSKIRNSADRAKIISSNDTSGFTFRGRFLTSEEAVQIGYEVSQKAHNSLKFLVEKQGQRVGEKMFLLWGTKNENVPKIDEDTLDFCLYGEDMSEYSDTQEECAKILNKIILGYKGEIHDNTKYAIIVLDSSTKGRMSINYYREYIGKQGYDLIERVKNWHCNCKWYHSYRFIKKKRVPFFGVPSISEIALCAYGVEQNEFIVGDKKLIAKTMEKILPCITEGAKIPKDVVNILIKKCYSPQNYSSLNNWLKVLSITCSMYKKYIYDYKEKEVISMEIDNTSTNIAYNCGRLLAVADAIETWALQSENAGEKDDIRTTNAIRYFNRFTRMPCSTWEVINNKLIHYKRKLGEKASYLNNLMGDISKNINPEEFAQAKNLDGRMALGFDSQRKAIIDRSISLGKEKKNKEA